MATFCRSCRLEDGVNCTIVSQELLGILRGFNYPYYVASFGNSRLDNLLDWVQIKTNFNPTVSEVKQGAQYLTMITVIALSDESDDLN